MLALEATTSNYLFTPNTLCGRLKCFSSPRPFFSCLARQLPDVIIAKHAFGNNSKNKPAARLGTSTPVAANIFLIFSPTLDKFAAGPGQSVPFINTGFHTPRLTSAKK